MTPGVTYVVGVGVGLTVLAATKAVEWALSNPGPSFNELHAEFARRLR